MWERMAQLKLAPDLAAASRHRMCNGGLEEERKALFRVLGQMEETGWNIKLACILIKVLSKVILYTRALILRISGGAGISALLGGGAAPRETPSRHRSIQGQGAGELWV